MQGLRRDKFQCIGVALQEAHAGDVWPIGLPASLALNATFSVKDRVDNAKQMLETLEELREIPWFVDPPMTDANHHVAGEFNTVFAAWPHRYFVLDKEGKLLFRSPVHKKRDMEYFVSFQDLADFVETL